MKSRNLTNLNSAVLVLLSILLSCNPDDGLVEFTATVSGVLRDCNTGDPIVDALVELKQGNSTVTSVQTSTEGTYSMSDQVLGEELYSVTFSKDGYYDTQVEAFTLNAGNQTEELSNCLQPFAMIFGKIRNNVSGEPIEEALVTLVELDRNVSTNNLGDYQLDELLDDTYNLTVSKSGFETFEEEITVARGEFKNLDINLNPLSAEMEISTPNLDFGANEVSRTFEITNIGGDTIRWSIVENIAWVIANPTSGETTASESSTVTLTVDRNGFNPGAYAQTLTITSESSGSSELNLTMTINGAILQIIPSELAFGTESVEESLQLERIGQGTLNYEIQADKSWITVEPSSGSITNETDFIIVKADRTNLDFGNYEAKIAFNTDNDSQIINATLTVADPNAPQLTIDPLSLNMGQDVATRNITLQNTGKGSLDWSVSKSTAWLSVSASGGELVEGQAEIISVTVNRSSLTPGEYDDVLRFTSQGGNLNVPVTIEVANTPVLSLSEDVLDFGRDATTDVFVISNIGNGTMTWSVSTNQDWISLNPLSGTNTGTVNVTVSRDNLSFGSYSGQIDIESDGGIGSVIVEMDFLPPNEPPVADFTISNDVVNLGQEVNVDASGSSDPEDALSLLEVRWRFQTSGAFTEWSLAKQASVTYETQGIKEITLEVRDTDGSIASVSKEVNVIQNQPPNAVFSVNPSSGKINVTEFNVDATGSNDDIDETEDLQYRWRWEEGQSFTAWSRDATDSHVYGSIGTKTITLEVLDSFGDIGSTSLDVDLTEDLTEIEPNNVFTSANELVIGTEMLGDVGFGADNRDWFRISPDKNSQLKIIVVNNGSGTSADLDRVLIYEENFNYLTEVSNGGNSCCLKVEAGLTRVSPTFTVSAGRTYYVLLAPDQTTHATNYVLSISEESINQEDIGEPNNASDQATIVLVGESARGTVGFGSDEIDWFQVEAPSNGQLSLTAENLQTGSINGELDRAILYNSNITYLTEASNGGNSCCLRIPGGASYKSPNVTVGEGEIYFARMAPDVGFGASSYRSDASSYRIELNFEALGQEDVGEPNNTSDQATTIAIGESLRGTVGFGEDAIDWFEVVMPSNGQLRLTAENIQTGSVNGELDRAILYDSEITYLTEASNGGNSCCLRIPGGASYTSPNVTVSEGESYFIRIAPDDGLDASSYRIELSFEAVNQEDIGEPNGSPDQATMIPLGESIRGTVGFQQDALDWYWVEAPSNGQLFLTVENLQTGSVNGELDRAILYNSDLSYLTEASNGGNSCCLRIPGGVSYTSTGVSVSAGEIYYIRIAPDDGLDASFYRVEVNFEE